MDERFLVLAVAALVFKLPIAAPVFLGRFRVQQKEGFEPLRAEGFRLVIDNREARPLKISGVRARGFPKVPC